jgi:hypothetical protein
MMSTKVEQVNRIMNNGATTRSEQGNRDMITRRVTLTGIVPIMFDRYAGDNDTQLTPSQKLYFGEDGCSLVIPATNVMSFLSAKNTDSAPKRLLDSRKYKKFTEACASFVMITRDSDDYSENLPLTRDGEPLIFDKFNDAEVCESSGLFIKRDVARLEKGIPNPKVRPVLPTPWEVSFRLSLFPNDQIQEQQLKNVFEKGGVAVGLGTWRGRFGKFVVSSWK